LGGLNRVEKVPSDEELPWIDVKATDDVSDE
jgi:hypothetical protein